MKLNTSWFFFSRQLDQGKTTIIVDYACRSVRSVILDESSISPSPLMNVLDLFFPKFCLGCGKWGSYVCTSCFCKIRPLPYLKCPICGRASIDGCTHPRCKKRFGLDRLISFFPYTGIIQKAIKTIKYRYAYKVTDDVLRNVSFVDLPTQSMFATIPLHPSRRRLRGFNQAEIIAKVLLKRFDISVRTDILKRVRKTIPQVDMKNREDRLLNMKGVFVVNKENIPAILQNTIILVDDVYPTGATMQSACEVLKR